MKNYTFEFPTSINKKVSHSFRKRNSVIQWIDIKYKNKTNIFNDKKTSQQSFLIKLDSL